MENNERNFGNDSSNLKYKSVDGGFENPDSEKAGMISEIGSKISDSIRHAGSDMSDNADNAITTAGQKMTNLAGKLRKSSEADGTIGSAVGAVADGIESSGKYLANSSLSGIEHDLVSVVRRHPIPSIWVGIGLGVLVGSLVSRR